MKYFYTQQAFADLTWEVDIPDEMFKDPEEVGIVHQLTEDGWAHLWAAIYGINPTVDVIDVDDEELEEIK